MLAFNPAPKNRFCGVLIAVLAASSLLEAAEEGEPRYSILAHGLEVRIRVDTPVPLRGGTVCIFIAPEAYEITEVAAGVGLPEGSEVERICNVFDATGVAREGACILEWRLPGGQPDPVLLSEGLHTVLRIGLNPGAEGPPCDTDVIFVNDLRTAPGEAPRGNSVIDGQGNRLSTTNTDGTIYPLEDCCNFMDDDCDGLTDLDDSDCSSAVCPCGRDPFELYFSDGDRLPLGLGEFSRLPVDGELRLQGRSAFTVSARHPEALQSFEFGIRVGEGEAGFVFELVSDLTDESGNPIDLSVVDVAGNEVRPPLPNRLSSAVGKVRRIEPGWALLEYGEGGLLEYGLVPGGFWVRYVAGSETGVIPASPDFDICPGNELVIVHIGSPFERGDANDDGAMDISDGVFVLNHLFAGGPHPVCIDAADTNDDGKVDVADGVMVFNFLFAGGPNLPPPQGECGIDPSPDELACGDFSSC